MAMNVAQQKTVNLLKTFFCSSVFISVCVFNVWPKTTLPPVWSRDAKSLETPGRGLEFSALLFQPLHLNLLEVLLKMTQSTHFIRK